MPDNPHPHPSGFTGSRQILLLAILKLILRGMTPLTGTQAAPVTNTKATAFNYIIKPEN